ncbi:MFS transporter [Streptomyces sp. C10-9-1]|uniref:MFS transporter n=1 Tax=Streptomyces sp. C10-9-1 TaxID=1859285 RepID=UPI002111CB17|nr:MFS transporter [Streptomyces sp. C10-9-1]MCQ6553285.1 MFS transporter [Streptomyces sp. C10-9-1]
MLTVSSRPPAAVRRLERRLSLYAGLEDFVLLYPLYALLFAEHGLSTAEMSSLFALWSLTALVVEVPSGVWADLVSRRLLLVLGPLLTATGFALWALLPSYAAFAGGFVLWGVGGALRSGAYEALAFEELSRLGAGTRYARAMGRASAWSMAATAAATAAAAPVAGLWGMPAVAAASVAACLLCAVAGAALPEHRAPEGGADRSGGAPLPAPAGEGPGTARPAGAPGPGGGCTTGAAATARGLRAVAVLRSGAAEVRGTPRVRRALLLVVAVTAVWGALDEYVPLLASATGAPPAAVPLLVLLVWTGVTAGALLVGPAMSLGPRALGALLAAGALATAAGALWGRPAGFVGVAAGFLVFQLVDVVADARLQAAVSGPGRATITSLAGLGKEGATLGVFGAYAALSSQAGHGPVFALLVVPYLLVALVLGVRPRGAGGTAVPGEADRAAAGDAGPAVPGGTGRAS